MLPVMSRTRLGLLVAAGYGALLVQVAIGASCPVAPSSRVSCQRVHELLQRRPMLTTIAPMRADAPPVQVASR